MSNDLQEPTNSSLRMNSYNDAPLLDPEEMLKEQKYLETIIVALRYYRKYSYARLNKTESYLASLSSRHQHMLIKYRKHLTTIRDCIDENQTVINIMLREKFLCHDLADASTKVHRDDETYVVKIRTQDMENQSQVHVDPFKILKAQSTLKLIARDWSDEGAIEREQSYKPIIDAIECYFNPDRFELNEIKILVPGAGLGRLTYELACRGYECEGNEVSYFMMIASNFILNECTEARKYTLYPWIHQYVNNLRMEDQVTSICFPDVCPSIDPPKGKIAMAAGDFLQVYTDFNQFDCVATCFFLDCANNIIDFIETIYKILVPGGIWVNLGPLLYHFSDINSENSIEPTYENLIPIIEAVGFEILRNEAGVRTKYAQNPNSMLKTEYESVFWTCRKPLIEPANKMNDNIVDIDPIDDNENENRWNGVNDDFNLVTDSIHDSELTYSADYN